MIWARLAATGPNRESLGKIGSYKLDSDIEHISKSTTDWLKNKESRCFIQKVFCTEPHENFILSYLQILTDLLMATLL